MGNAGAKSTITRIARNPRRDVLQPSALEATLAASGVRTPQQQMRALKNRLQALRAELTGVTYQRDQAARAAARDVAARAFGSPALDRLNARHAALTAEVTHVRAQMATLRATQRAAPRTVTPAQ